MEVPETTFVLPTTKHPQDLKLRTMAKRLHNDTHPPSTSTALPQQHDDSTSQLQPSQDFQFLSLTASSSSLTTSSTPN